MVRCQSSDLDLLALSRINDHNTSTVKTFSPKDDRSLAYSIGEIAGLLIYIRRCLRRNVEGRLRVKQNAQGCEMKPMSNSHSFGAKKFLGSEY